MKKRYVWADLARITAIYLVLVIHSSPAITYVPKSMQFLFFFLSGIATTSVPLFVMLSGALLLNKKETYSTFFKKRFSRLFFPWITWTIIYTCFTIFTHHIFSLPQIVRAFITTFESFWFLPMIAVLYLFTPAIRLFIIHAKNRDIFFILVLWFLGVSLLPYTKNSLAFPLQVDDGLVRQVISFWGYFILGIYAQKYIVQKIWLPLGIMSTTIGGLWTLLFYQTHQVGNFLYYIAPHIVLLSFGLFLLLRVLGLAFEKTSGVVKKLIATMSSCALGIYFIHPFIQLLFQNIFRQSNVLFIYPAINAFVNGALLFALSFICMLVLFAIPFVKKYIS